MWINQYLVKDKHKIIRFFYYLKNLKDLIFECIIMQITISNILRYYMSDRTGLNRIQICFISIRKRISYKLVIIKRDLWIFSTWEKELREFIYFKRSKNTTSSSLLIWLWGKGYHYTKRMKWCRNAWNCESLQSTSTDSYLYCSPRTSMATFTMFNWTVLYIVHCKNKSFLEF